jgi:hypothetical protein
MHQTEIEENDRQAGEERRDKVDPIGDVADGEQREKLAQKNVQRVASGVSNPQGVGDDLELETIGFAHRGREGAQIDGESQNEETRYKSQVPGPRSQLQRPTLADGFPFERGLDFEGHDEEDRAAQQHLGLEGIHFSLSQVEEQQEKGDVGEGVVSEGLI